MGERFYGKIVGWEEKAGGEKISIQVSQPREWQSQYPYPFNEQFGESPWWDEEEVRNGNIDIGYEGWFEADQGRHKGGQNDGSKKWHYYWDNLRLAEPPAAPQGGGRGRARGRPRGGRPQGSAERPQNQNQQQQQPTPAPVDPGMETQESISRSVALQQAVKFRTATMGQTDVPIPTEADVRTTAEEFLKFLLDKE